ncbi:DVU0298 family protein [Desulfurivibrio sp. D14AmB]|uniref:DVU0298 family protein n=1 Tax=Desulfurivibrio sp. D14AmB TaxID=3374370 RepID=UPI00376EA985
MKGQQIKTPPRCVFCGQEIEPARVPEQRKLGEFSVGRCQCGAVYACDATGHNVGAAMVDALLYACDDDWDLAWDLLPDQDYLTGRLESYDEISHQVLDQRHLDGRYVRGVLYFVRLQREYDEIIKLRQAKNNPQTASPAAPEYLPPIEPERDPRRKKRRADKREVGRLALAGDLDALVDICFDDLKTLRYLQRLLYTPDEAERWRLAHLIGQVCARLATRQPGAVSDLLHRLFEACSDSAATPWGLVETMGSIIAARPDIYGGFARHMLRYVNHISTRSQVLWALGTIAARRPDLIKNTPYYQMAALLNDPDPLIRAMAVRILGPVAASEFFGPLANLTTDPSEVTFYQEGRPRTTTVGELAAQALKPSPPAA